MRVYAYTYCDAGSNHEEDSDCYIGAYRSMCLQKVVGPGGDSYKQQACKEVGDQGYKGHAWDRGSTRPALPYFVA